jgi:hypothetical protein
MKFATATLTLLALSLPVAARADDLWSLQPLRRPEPPAVRDAAWPHNPIDRFILAALEAKGIKPTAPADKLTLIRRATFDLTGLPPTPEEIDAFVADNSPDAYPRLIDRLLASKRYGERWARHWLDLARYADSDGYESDEDRPTAYHYRDFVIKSLNDDLPFDTFVKWQLAGDEYEPDNPWARVATGFCTAGPVVFLKANEGTPRELEQIRADELDDVVSTVGSAFLGLTVGCARCHDHKFDPVPTRDYYRLAAVFAPSKRGEITVKGSIKALALSDNGREPGKTYRLARGDPSRKAEEVTAGFLSVLSATPTFARWQLPPPPGRMSTFQRRALAEWLTDLDSGAGRLLARVIVNRLWQHHFGEGLVRTPNDFGHQGERPTHPELLDWLATELIREGWHLKPIHRLILTSAVYTQGIATDPAALTADPDNHLLGRRRPLRLEAEAVRDSILAVSGKLDVTMYGPAVKPFIPPEVMAGRNKDKLPRPAADGPAQWRRSVYLFTKRSLQTPFLEVLDAPNAAGSCGRRTRSTVAPQALLFLNDGFLRTQAGFFADRVLAEGGAEPDGRVRLAYRLALGRVPTAAEAEAARRFLDGQGSGRGAYVNLCQVLFGLNEFVYVD